MSSTQREPSHGPDATISRTVDALMAYRNVSRAELCQATHMSRGSYYNRMNGSRAWSAAEVADAAKALGVPVQTLYDGLPLDGGDGRARRDSNSQPSDPKSDVPGVIQFPIKPHLTLVRGVGA